MATSEEVAALRRMTDEPTTTNYTDLAFSAILDAATSAEAAAAAVWQEKAGRYASLVNTSESGSSRNMGDLHKNALNMAKHYASLASPGTDETINAPFTVDIERS
jgi:Cdc6-like AAA superfamily ATPase